MQVRIDFPQSIGDRLTVSFARPLRILEAQRLDEVAGVIAAADAQARQGCWAVGFVGYEAGPAFEPAMRVRPRGDPRLPLAAFAIYAQPESAWSLTGGASYACGAWRIDDRRTDVERAVEMIRARIAAGMHYQVNLTTRLRTAFSGDAYALFEALRAAQPNGYCAYLDHADWQVLSVSPELFFDWRADGTLTTRPMKGTAARSPDPSADAAAAQAMRASEKERAENLMIVDLLRNDMSRVAQTGSVRVPALFEVEALPTAWQMTSTIECKTRLGIGLSDVFAALFPCGSVTGAPKIAAMKTIAELETSPRGAYCGAIGVIRPGGHATFNVGIRTAVLDGARAECGVGSGITYDSTPGGEYDEWIVKRRFLLRASASFALIETMRLVDGAYTLRDRHVARLLRSAAHFGFAIERAVVERALDELAARHPRGSWRVRLLVDRTGVPSTEAHAFAPTAEPVRVALADTPIDGDDEFLAHKTTLRAVYERHAPPPGIFDTLLWNARGELTEFTRGNLVVEIDGERVTPAISCGLLPGVLREELLACGEIREGIVTRIDLTRATRIWFINSLRGMLCAQCDSPIPD